MSSWEMKLGSMIMTLRPRFQVLNGRSPVSLHGKKKKKFHQWRSKVMLTVFLDLDGIVSAEFVPRSTTMNSGYYKGLLECLRKDMARKWPEKWTNGFIFHHHSVLCCTSLPVVQFLPNKNICILIHLIHHI